MQYNNIPSSEHSHTFGQDEKQSGEARTIVVIVITAMMMVVEIATGVIFGSIALLADGLHMASHAAALTINAFAYIYARREAYNNTFSFGTGKVNALGGFTGAVLLSIFALIMGWESVDRLFHPIDIAFNQAILVAVAGLFVNGGSVLILGVQDSNDHHHSANKVQKSHHDHNLRAAYLHVLADALTSILAIFALLTGKYFGFYWMDPIMGIIGALLVFRWSLGLIRTTSWVLLDKEGPKPLRNWIFQRLAKYPETKVTDFHLWSIGPNLYSVIISITAKSPESPQKYKNLLSSESSLVHMTIEVNQSIDFKD